MTKIKRTPDEARIHRNKLARERRAAKKQAEMAAEAPPVPGLRDGTWSRRADQPMLFIDHVNEGTSQDNQEETMNAETGGDDFDDSAEIETDHETLEEAELEDAPKRRPRAARVARASLTGQQSERLRSLFAAFRKMNLSGYQGIEASEFLAWAQTSSRAQKTLGLVSYSKASASEAAGGALLRLDLQPMVANVADVAAIVSRALSTFGVPAEHDPAEPNYMLIQI